MTLFDAPSLARFRARAATRDPSFLDTRIWETIDDAIDLLHRRPATALFLGPQTPAAQDFAARRDLELTDALDRAGEVELVLMVRWAETEDDLPEKLGALALVLPPDTPLLGAALGGDSLRGLRDALISADRAAGSTISARTHPRIEPAAFAELLQRAGWAQPVVNLDRVDVRYSSVQRLIGDLRDLGASNALVARDRRPLTRDWRQRLERAFPAGTTERFDVVHFSAWTPAR